MHLCVTIFKLLNFATVPGINKIILQRLCIRRLSLTCRESKLGSYIAESPKNAPKNAMSNATGMKIEDLHHLGRVNLLGFFLSALPEIWRWSVERLFCLLRHVKTLQMLGNGENLTSAMWQHPAKETSKFKAREWKILVWKGAFFQYEKYYVQLWMVMQTPWTWKAVNSQWLFWAQDCLA